MGTVLFCLVLDSNKNDPLSWFKKLASYLTLPSKSIWRLIFDKSLSFKYSKPITPDIKLTNMNRRIYKTCLRYRASYFTYLNANLKPHRDEFQYVCAKVKFMVRRCFTSQIFCWEWKETINKLFYIKYHIKFYMFQKFKNNF